MWLHWVLLDYWFQCEKHLGATHGCNVRVRTSTAPSTHSLWASCCWTKWPGLVGEEYQFHRGLCGLPHWDASMGDASCCPWWYRSWVDIRIHSYWWRVVWTATLNEHWVNLFIWHHEITSLLISNLFTHGEGYGHVAPALGTWHLDPLCHCLSSQWHHRLSDNEHSDPLCSFEW